MKTALIIVGILALIVFVVLIYAICVSGKTAEIIEGILEQSHKEL